MKKTLDIFAVYIMLFENKDSDHEIDKQSLS